MNYPIIFSSRSGYCVVTRKQDLQCSATQNKSNYQLISMNEKAPQKVDRIIGAECGYIPAATRSVATLKEFQASQLNIAQSVMDKLKFNLNVTTLLSPSDLLNTVDSDVGLATQQQMKTTKELQKKLISHIAGLLSNKFAFSLKETEKVIRLEFKEAAIKLRNEKTWQTVQTRFEHNSKEYVCTLIPAGQMKNGKSDIFPHSYQNNGVCSASTTETKHATNLWMSEIAGPGDKGEAQILFKGIRHGILSPYGLKNDDPVRASGALSRAKEVVAAALYAKPDLFNKALAGEPVPLQIVSTSLVTASQIGGEDEMLKDQINAWQSLSEKKTVSLSVMGNDGKLQQVTVNLAVAAFNFGVNEMALKFGLGRSTSDGYNAQALKQLLGGDLTPNSPPGGMVGKYLASTPTNGDKVRALSQQLKQILVHNSHHRDGGEPYKAAQRVAMLAYEIGAVPCWNCKSGKDRTGMLDAEIKREVVSQHQGLPLSKPGQALSNSDKKLFQQVLVNGGNSEVQIYNTGAAGNQVLKKLPILNLSYGERIGNNEVWNEAQGLSRLVRS
ncbi:Inositol phosphate phosphatase sopB [Yersinia aldovae]|uniref:inositol phosphate phosphatase SopB n=1 Tax=Yersinia aldovae TaxID=29483 RepID=UPI0005E5D763|nr:inositol phosphate phosphatase SopB [Yersinia aldovae]CNI25630.1 Inositol phosphate phosphatase sopB [Yersinia aldovae]